MTVLQILILVLAVANFSVFIWGVFGFFVKKGTASSGLTVIKVASPIGYLTELYALSRPDAVEGAFGILGIAGFVGSWFLFWSALKANREKPLSLAYSPDLPQHLTQTGPYRFVRHPFYVSYLLAFTAGWIGSGQLWVGVVPVVMVAIYIHAAKSEEKKFSQSEFAKAYEAYQARTGMFLPKWAARH